MGRKCLHVRLAWVCIIERFLLLRGVVVITRFSKETRDKLKSYVYTYTDPRNNKGFYVGKGENNRCFSHLGREDEEFRARLDAIKSSGYEPKIDILAAELSEEEAFVIEAAVIETYGIENLLNKAKGKKVRKRSVDDIERQNNNEEVDLARLPFNVLRISINQTYPSIDPHNPFELYEITRSSWSFEKGPKEALNPESVPYVLASYNDRVMEVYKVEAWFKSSSLMHSRGYGSDNRHAFVGNVAEDSIRKLFVNKKLPSRSRGEANPLKVYKKRV